MDLNLKRVLALIQKDVENNWTELDWEFEQRPEEVVVSTSISLKNIKGGIRAIIRVYVGGGVSLRAVFDKLEPTEEVLKLVNKFNEEQPFFKAFIREDGFLELSSFFVAYEMNMFKSYASEFLCRIDDLAEDDIIQTLASFTYIED